MMNCIRYLSLFVERNIVNGYRSSSFLTVFCGLVNLLSIRNSQLDNYHTSYQNVLVTCCPHKGFVDLCVIMYFFSYTNVDAFIFIITISYIHIGGPMLNVIASSAVDRGFGPRSRRINLQYNAYLLGT